MIHAGPGRSMVMLTSGKPVLPLLFASLAAFWESYAKFDTRNLLMACVIYVLDFRAGFSHLEPRVQAFDFSLALGWPNPFVFGNSFYKLNTRT